MIPQRMRDAAQILGELGNGRMANELLELAERVDLRYRIVGDNSGHEYYIPIARDAEWQAFAALDEEDERSWNVPEFAERIDGRFTFTDPRCE